MLGLPLGRTFRIFGKTIVELVPSLLAISFGSKAWAIGIGALGLVYGLMGVFLLGVMIDWLLSAGAVLLRRLSEGESVALVSDAGTPAISDPGYELVREAIHGDVTVEVVPGPSALISALVISLVIGPWLISKLRDSQHGGETIREDTPERHRTKKGTPTMGGVIILASIVTSTILWANLRNRYVWVVVLATLGFGLIGVWDDLRKLRTRKGVSARTKLGLQLLLALVLLQIVFWQPRAEWQPVLAIPFFVLSLKAGGFGLNLTRANHVFHYDRWWNPAVERQAVYRAHRFERELPLHVFRFTVIDTIEERIAFSATFLRYAEVLAYRTY